MDQNENVIEPIEDNDGGKNEEILTGVVVAKHGLNIRVDPDPTADYDDMTPYYKPLADGTIVMIEMDESTEDFYKVYTENGREGFCMKKFIQVNP